MPWLPAPCHSLRPPFGPLKPSTAVKSFLYPAGLDSRLLPAQHFWSRTRRTCSPDKQAIFDQGVRRQSPPDGLFMAWARRCSGKRSLLKAVSDQFIAHSGVGWDFNGRLQTLFKDFNSVCSFTLVLSASVCLEDQGQPWIQRLRQNSFISRMKVQVVIAIITFWQFHSRVLTFNQMEDTPRQQYNTACPLSMPLLPKPIWIKKSWCFPAWLPTLTHCGTLGVPSWLNGAL